MADGVDGQTEANREVIRDGVRRVAGRHACDQ